jgi:isoleucyl-tRNA synthetase
VITRNPREGTVVATEGSITVALDTQLSQDLLTEGVARELVNRIQMIRRSEGRAVTDRIRLRWASDAASIVEAFRVHDAFIAGEVLATAIVRDHSITSTPISIDGAEVALSIADD